MNQLFVPCRRLPSAILTGALVFLSCRTSECHAQVVLDQFHLGVAGNAYIVSADQTPLSQGVVAGASGVLTRVDLAIARQADAPELPLIFSIRDTLGGADVFSIALPTVELATGFSLYTIDTSSFGFSTVVGQTFFLTLASEAPVTGGNINPYGWFFLEDDGYAPGGAYIRDYGPISGELDYVFATYVAVPEPATWAAVFGGLSLLGVLGWRVRRNRAG